MIQYSICVLGCVIFFVLSKVAVRHNHEKLGFVSLIISSTFLIMIVMRFSVKDFKRVIDGVVNFVNWIIKG